MPQTWTAQVFRLGSATVGQHNKWKKGWKQDPDDKTCHREIPERWKEKENLNGFQEKEKRSATKDPKKKKKKSSDFSTAVLKTRKEWSNAFRILRGAILAWNLNRGTSKLKREGKKRLFSIFQGQKKKKNHIHSWLGSILRIHSWQYKWVNQKRGRHRAQEMRKSKSKKDVGKSWTPAYNRLTGKQSWTSQQRVMEEKFLLKRED